MSADRKITEKKSIAFSWVYPLQEQSGGVERVTLRLMAGLRARGHNCEFLLDDLDSGRLFFRGEPVADLGEFLSQNSIDTLINQNGYSTRISDLVERSKWSGNYIVCHHSEPKYLQKVYNFQRILREFFVSQPSHSEHLKWLARLFLFPLWRFVSSRNTANIQKRNYSISSKYVVLSQSFIKELSAWWRTKELSKVVGIPNPLSYDQSSAHPCEAIKKKIALVVARINDGEKRISSALRVWKRVEDSGCHDWSLHVVGDGPDLEKMRAYSKAIGVKRVTFFGRQDPVEHYRSASIFFMTSRIEGWGLTLTEAMQHGVVPVAMDAYASLHDILSSSENGLIVKDGDERAFAEAVVELIENAPRLSDLATSGEVSCQKFTVEKVLDHWEAII